MFIFTLNFAYGGWTMFVLDKKLNVRETKEEYVKGNY
jgi:hypothetical protein